MYMNGGESSCKLFDMRFNHLSDRVQIDSQELIGNRLRHRSRDNADGYSDERLVDMRHSDTPIDVGLDT